MLEGIRVLDLSRVLAGPLCAMTLGDLGARVIKVERPGSGDETRAWGPPFDERGESAYYLSINRNKLSVALDFDDADDVALVASLADEADVVIENFLPGALERRGLAPALRLAANPRLIWCTLTGFGARSERPGYDFVVQAESGWMAITGEPAGSPMKVGVALADVIAGKDAAVAILAAIAARSRNEAAFADRNRHLVISLLHSATASLVNVAQNALVSGHDAARWGNAHPNLCPYELFETADGSLVIAVGTDAHWRACMSVLGLDDLARDEALATNRGRLANRARIVTAITGALRKHGALHWVEQLQRSGVPCGVVRSVLDAVEAAGGTPRTGIPPAAGGTVRYEPPLLGQHGGLIRRMGWNAFAESTALPDVEPEH